MNSIFWENVDDADAFAGGPFADESAQIHTISGAPTVSYSAVQGGWTGDGSNNVNADPLFVDADNGDFRIAVGSPCIDAGDNTAVPPGVTSDLAGNP